MSVVRTEYLRECKQIILHACMVHYEGRARVRTACLSTEYLSEVSTEYLNEVSTEYLSEVSTEYMSKVSTEYMSEVSTEYMSEVSTEYLSEVSTEYLTRCAYKGEHGVSEKGGARSI